MFTVYDLILVLPAILLAFYAQYRVKSTFNKYMSVKTARGVTGAQAARYMLDRNGLHNVDIERADGFLSDHYDPRSRVVRLSPEVYNGTSVSSLGVAAHETGHAVQHSNNYLPLIIRSGFAPVASFSSTLAMPLILLGFILRFSDLIFFGIIAFSAAVLFQVITLPVEFNASKRALAALSQGGFINHNELRPTKKVLNAAALTYVAATLVAVTQLISFILSMISSSDD